MGKLSNGDRPGRFWPGFSFRISFAGMGVVQAWVPHDSQDLMDLRSLELLLATLPATLMDFQPLKLEQGQTYPWRMLCGLVSGEGRSSEGGVTEPTDGESSTASSVGEYSYLLRR